VPRDHRQHHHLGPRRCLSRVVVVGVCMDPDQFRPALAINKEIDLRFVLGYTPIEFRDTLHMLGRGQGQRRAHWSPAPSAWPAWTRRSPALGDPEQHAKILIDPASAVTEPVCSRLSPASASTV